jgi:hypothetical protein
MINLTLVDRFLFFRAPGRRIEIFPDDIFLVSYPRSGGTWMRFLITTLLEGHSPDFVRINALLADIYGTSRLRLKSLARPRLLKSHEYFDPRYKRVIYLVRDPRDVVISYYDFHKRERVIPQDIPLNSYVDRFVTGRLDSFGTWREHVGSWLGARFRTPGFLLLRYEDLKSTTVSELRRIVDFIGLERDDARLALAVEQCSLAAMRKIERMQAKQGVIDRRRFDMPGIRSGVVGGWRNQLDRGLEAQITDAFYLLMRDLGYLDDSSIIYGKVRPGSISASA